MTVGDREIFGPVLCIKRVKDFEEGLAVMNANPFANGSVIFTQNGHYAREFVSRTDGGMVGVNVGILCPSECSHLTDTNSPSSGIFIRWAKTAIVSIQSESSYHPVVR